MSTGRVLPHDLDAEAAVLSAILLDDRALDEVCDFLAPAHYYADANSRIYAAIITLRETGKPIDVLTVAGYLRDISRLAQVGGTPYLAQITDATPAISHIAAHARRIVELARQRSAVRLAQEYVATGYEPIEDVQGWLDEFEAGVFGVAHSTATTDSLGPMSEAIHEAMLGVHAATKALGGVTGTRTGIARLDKLLCGLQPGDLYILAGRPGMGKSGKALLMAVSAASGSEPKTAAFFSLEMPRAQLGTRAVSMTALVDLSKMRSGVLQPSDWDRITAAEQELARLPIHIDDTPSITLLHLRAKVRRLQARVMREGLPPLGIVVIDYLQLMRGSSRAGNREQEISELSRGLKALAKEMGVPVVALSQLNRSVELRADKRPQISDLRESGAIEQDADAIIFVYRDEYYNKDSPDQGIAELIVAKQRNGPTGTVRARFQAAFTRFTNLEESEYEFDQYATEDPWGDFEGEAVPA